MVDARAHVKATIITSDGGTITLMMPGGGIVGLDTYTRTKITNCNLVVRHCARNTRIRSALLHLPYRTVRHDLTTQNGGI